MNRRLTLTLSILIVVGAALLWQSRRTDEASVAAAEEVPASEPAAVLGVDQFMQAVDDYRGPVLVEGAVSAVVAGEQTLALIDVSELAQCGVVTCATLTRVGSFICVLVARPPYRSVPLPPKHLRTG